MEVTLATTTTSNKWTQAHEIHDHHHNFSMASSSNTRVMEKPGQELLQQQQQALKCPRCDSSNTKFCYYNNYSLSQPRHFCKACKRYWTRGGTLRNVPVGGGCRKNKRVKRVDTSNNNNASPSPSSSNPSSNNSKSNLPSKSHIDAASTTSSYINTNTLYYGLPTTTASHNSCDVNVMDLNPIFPRVSSYDLHPQLNNALGFGFGSNNSNTTTLLSNAYNSIFGGSSTCAPSNPVMASLLSSTLLQQKFMKDNDHGSNNFQGLGSLEEMVASKEMKVEGQNRNMVESWNNNNGGGVNSNCQNNSNQMEHVGFSDPSSLYWNTASAWSDQLPNIGPNSVTSLI